MICFRSKFVFCPFVFKSLQCASFSQRRYDTGRLIMRLPEMFKSKIMLLKQSGSVDNLTVWLCLRTYLYLVSCVYSIAIDRYTKLVKLKARKLLMFSTTLHRCEMSRIRYCFTITRITCTVMLSFRHIMCYSCNP
jgi:hypothetical protein